MGVCYFELDAYRGQPKGYRWQMVGLHIVAMDWETDKRRYVFRNKSGSKCPTATIVEVKARPWGSAVEARMRTLLKSPRYAPDRAYARQLILDRTVEQINQATLTDMATRDQDGETYLDYVMTLGDEVRSAVKSRFPHLAK